MDKFTFNLIRPALDSNDVLVLVSPPAHQDHATTALKTLYGHVLPEVRRRCGFVTACNGATSRLLIDESQCSSLNFVGLYAFPFEILNFEHLGQVKKLLPFAEFKHLEVLFVHRIDLVPLPLLQEVMRRWQRARISSKPIKLVGSSCSAEILESLKRVHRSHKSAAALDVVLPPKAGLGDQVCFLFPVADGERRSWNPEEQNAVRDMDARTRFHRANELADVCCARAADSFADDAEQWRTRQALSMFFAQFPAALDNPRLQTLPKKKVDMKLLEWFTSEHQHHATALPMKELPFIAPECTAMEVALENERATQELPSLERVFLEQVTISAALKDYVNYSACSQALKSGADNGESDVATDLWQFLGSVLPPVVVLRVGMPVMLLVTLSSEFKEGEVGMVTSFENGEKPEVTFAREHPSRGRDTIVIEPVSQTVVIGNTLKSLFWYTITQIPLAPAFVLGTQALEAIQLKSSATVAPEIDIEQVRGLVDGQVEIKF
jgi:hypothetical protein